MKDRHGGYPGYDRPLPDKPKDTPGAPMTDIVSFLKDRLTELEKSANQLHSIHCGCVRNPIAPCDCGVMTFVLWGVEAKRAILIECKILLAAQIPSYMEEEIGYLQGVEFAVYALAEEWADHPGYPAATKDRPAPFRII